MIEPVVKSEHLSKKGAKRMPDSEAKKKWTRENTTMIHIKLNHNTDKDLLEFFETVDNRAGFIKGLVREYIKEHQPKPQPDYSWLFEDESEDSELFTAQPAGEE